MAAVGGEDDLSMVIGAEGHKSLYSWNEVSEYLNGEKLSSERGRGGGVFWSGTDVVSEKIASVLKRMILEDGSLVQFWAVGVEERHRYLTIREQPFCVGGFLRWSFTDTLNSTQPPATWFDGFRKGACWYRKVCMDESGRVMVHEDAGPVGRVYRNKRPESSPDLRLYSSHEFPLRDHAARCGYRAYLAVPVFAVLDNHECVGVLEVLSSKTLKGIYAPPFHNLLKEVELGSTSTHDGMSIKYDERSMREILSILLLPIEAIPQVHLVQIWVPCRTCTNSSILGCIQRAEYKQARDCDSDGHMQEYIHACSFHHQQIHPTCSSSSQPLSISLAHYAHKARLSHRLLLCLESRHTDAIYVVEYFLDARRDSHLRYLIKIMEMKLKDSFRFTCEGQEIFLWPNNNNLNLSELEFSVKYCHRGRYGHSNFKDYLCEAQPCIGHESGWVFCKPGRRKSKIEGVIKKIAARLFTNCFLLVQFWAPKMGGQGRLYLETEEQPYALSYLDDGLTSYRKECTKHHYFVDEEAKPEELGPPGRVFRNGHMEISPDLRLYSADEFPLRNHAVQCRHRPQYIALPVFEVDDHDHMKCVGVLEFVGFTYVELQLIRQLLRDAKLCWSHHSHRGLSSRRMLGYDYEAALSEVREALSMSTMIPQLCMAEAWLPYGTNINDLNSCMELARVFSTNKSKKLKVITCNVQQVEEDEIHWSHVHTGKGKGILGMVLASENKSCFSPDLCDLSIAQEPLAHFLIQQRCGLCFAICLKSLHTGDLPYVLKFFLNPLSPSPTTARHLHTFLKFLLPTLRLNLKTFHIASGKQLDEMVVDIIEFSQANIFPPFSDSDTFPFKFKRAPYGEHQHTEDDEHTIQNSVVSVLKKSPVIANTQGGYENIKTPFGKRLIDFQEELAVGAGRSVIKRVCRHNCYHMRTQHVHLCDELEEEEKVIVIVKQDDAAILSGTRLSLGLMKKIRKVLATIIFETRLSLGVKKIRQEVATRLDLDATSLKLKYLDEENNKILLACDDDFKLCPMRRTPTGQPCIRLFAK